MNKNGQQHGIGKMNGSVETTSNRTRINFSRHTTVGRQNPYDRPDDITVEGLQLDVAPVPFLPASMLVLKEVPSQI